MQVSNNTLTTFDQATFNVNEFNPSDIENFKTWADLTDSEKQAIGELWCKTNVIYNVNQVVNSVLLNPDSPDWDTVQDLSESKDYTAPVEWYIENDLDDEEINDLFEELDLSDTRGVFSNDEKVRMILMYIGENDTYEQYASDNNIEPNIDETLEFWLVSDHFARMLPDSIAHVLGLTIWGRGCSGQSIYLDCDVQVAAFKSLSNCHYDHY